MTAFVLMKAMPPTKGHLHLIQFASRLAPKVVVVIDTLEDEPYVGPRVTTIREAVKDFHTPVEVVHITDPISPDPNSPGFWEEWKQIMLRVGAKPGDLVVGSEPYCKKVADLFDGKFYPYDPSRDIFTSKATDVRLHPDKFFSVILPEFQHYLRQTVTLFGAESTGKTTLSKHLAAAKNGHWLMEWARPYLEMNGAPPITVEVMTDIWHGQRALQDHARFLIDKPWVFQDTDLFSTVGYWNFWNMKTPDLLKMQALSRKSDLYLITKSNIPFEQDPIRYGGDVRESDDQFWIDLAEQHCLNYRVLESADPNDRMQEAFAYLNEHWQERVASHLAYERFESPLTIAGVQNLTPA